MKKTREKSDIACGGGFWWNRDGLVYIGWRKSSRAGRLRELAALAALLAAVGLMLVGLVVPQSLGLANNHIIYLAGSALVLAAGIHLFLIISWVRGAWAV
ncbi:MAG: hypothetical protein HKL95_09040, partial [Phycisphaerae bacterium]|nr:hypothetical protein [Phycisphaerae bacterium]